METNEQISIAQKDSDRPEGAPLSPGLVTRPANESIEAVESSRLRSRLNMAGVESFAGFELCSMATEGGGVDSSLAEAMDWVQRDRARSTLITLQGAQIVWSDRRIAILAPFDRLQSVKAAVLEVHACESELCEIERKLWRLWPEMKADLPHAFEMEKLKRESSAALKTRFIELFDLNNRLLKLAPVIHRPHVYPPTLASQIHERARERLQLMERHEFVSDQVEGAQHVYELCATRMSELKLAEKGIFYERLIVGLLLLQVVHAFLGLS